MSWIFKKQSKLFQNTALSYKPHNHGIRVIVKEKRGEEENFRKFPSKYNFMLGFGKLSNKGNHIHSSGILQATNLGF